MAERILVALPPTAGVLTRRVVAYLFDLLFIALLSVVAWIAAGVLTIISFGLLHGLFVIAAFVPLIYTIATLSSGSALDPRRGATWGMRLMSIAYRRDEDGGAPTLVQAIVVTILFYLTISATIMIVLVVPLFSPRRRTLHDMLSGLVMIRTDGVAWTV